MNIPSEKELMKAGLHFGHKPENWHPKMANFIYGQKNGVHIIDLIKSRQKMSGALEFVKKIVSDGGKILFVGTKIQAKEIVKKYAMESNMPYVEEKWLGGTITNFKVINGLVKKLENLENQATKEDYEKKYTKKERLEFSLEIEHLRKNVEGIRNLTSLPKAIFLTSAKHEKTALLEARKKNIPLVAVCDSNANPDDVDYPIPGNDDAIKAIELVTSLIAQAVKEGTPQQIVKN